jgi:hypothetical protein
MGLTIHFTLRFKGTANKATALVHNLHKQAKQIFHEVDPILQLSGKNVLLTEHDPEWTLKYTAQRSRIGRDKTYSRIPPKEFIGFSAYPGEGSESVRIGLASYPTGWYWQSFCKTQYASNPECGGIKNFLKCHLAVISLLECAKQAGIRVSVSDGGHYWETRNLQRLVESVGSYNQFIAAMAGALKDKLGDGLMTEITKFPNFERLEAEGNGSHEAATKVLLDIIKNQL